MPTTAVSPLHRYIEEGLASDFGPGLLQTHAPQPFLEWSARNTFFEAGVTQLDRLVEFLGLVPEKPRTLFGTIRRLVVRLMGPEPAELDRILGLRGMPAANLLSEAVPEEVVAEIMQEGEEKDFQASWNWLTTLNQPTQGRARK